MSAPATLASLPAWHEWASVLAWSMLALVAALAVLQFWLSVNGSWPSRIVRGGSLRTSLIVLLSILGSVPVLAVGVLLAERSGEARVQRIADRMTETTASVRDAIDQFIDKHLSGVTSAASAISSAGRFDREQMTDWLLIYHRVYDDFLTMLHADRNGDIVAATSNMTGFLGSVPDLQAHNVRDREYFRAPMADGQPFVSQVFQGRNLGNDPIVAISAPLVNAAGDRIGIIEGSLDLTAFRDIDQARADLDGASLILTDQTGRVIYSSNAAAWETLTNIADSELLVAARVAGHGRVFSYAEGGASQRAQFLGVSALTETGWTVHLSTRIESVTAQIAGDYRAAALIAFVMWLVALIFAKSLVRRVTRSIDDMNAAIDGLQIEDDEEPVRTPWTTFLEFRPIFQHLRERATDLRSSYRRLKNSIAAGNKLRTELNQAIATKEVEIAARTEALREDNERLSSLSNIDTLTEIANRRAFMRFAQRAWRKCARQHEPAAIVLVDIDFFKQFNDTLGHQAGDECLQKVAWGLSECATRPLDLVARYGGEEFVAVLGNTTLDSALIVAARMCEVIARLGIVHPGSPHAHVTISCGVAAADPVESADVEETLGAADAALYAAKEAGRNCVAFSDAGKTRVFSDGSIKLDATGVLSILSAKRR